MTREEFLQHLGFSEINPPCERCGGMGTRSYGSTATWRGGVGGQAITEDMCDLCWGSGSREWTGPDQRKIRAEMDALKLQIDEAKAYAESANVARRLALECQDELMKERDAALRLNQAQQIVIDGLKGDVEKLEARWKQQMQKEAHANQIFLEYEAVVREILANERIHDEKLLARARAIVGPTEKRSVSSTDCNCGDPKELAPCRVHGYRGPDNPTI